jgi:hypothetical protein
VENRYVSAAKDEKIAERLEIKVEMNENIRDVVLGTLRPREKSNENKLDKSIGYHSCL